jgi:hypothetical protein
MFELRTLFVVGAGASCEAGLPAGNQLKHRIAQKLDIRFEDGSRLLSGDKDIVEALRSHVRRPSGQPGDINPYLHAAWRIRNAASQAVSIDAYLDAHQGDERMELCGKLGIVSSILEAESASKLNSSQSSYPMDFRHLESTWYNKFMQSLSERVRKNDLSTIFNQVSFIILNYDRCVEHFLMHGLKNYFGI